MIPPSSGPLRGPGRRAGFRRLDPPQGVVLPTGLLLDRLDVDGDGHPRQGGPEGGLHPLGQVVGRPGRSWPPAPAGGSRRTCWPRPAGSAGRGSRSPAACWPGSRPAGRPTGSRVEGVVHQPVERPPDEPQAGEHDVQPDQDGDDRVEDVHARSARPRPARRPRPRDVQTSVSRCRPSASRTIDWCRRPARTARARPPG